SPTDSKDFRQLFDRCSSNHATTASSVLPIAMPKVDATGRLVGMFAASAPRKTPGQTRNPKISSEAIAIQVGGQTGVTFSWTDASERPSSAVAKYTIAMSKQRPTGGVLLRFIETKLWADRTVKVYVRYWREAIGKKKKARRFLPSAAPTIPTGG